GVTVDPNHPGDLKLSINNTPDAMALMRGFYAFVSGANNAPAGVSAPPASTEDPIAQATFATHTSGAAVSAPSVFEPTPPSEDGSFLPNVQANFDPSVGQMANVYDPNQQRQAALQNSVQ